MRINNQHKITASLMAIVVLFSTLSFTVKSHYCGNTLIDSSVFSETQKCVPNAVYKTTPKKGCCKDEVQVFEGQKELKQCAFEDLELSKQKVLSAVFYAYKYSFNSLKKPVVFYKKYSPPRLIYDYQILHETFLI